jgi:hypothetical protein
MPVIVKARGIREQWLAKFDKTKPVAENCVRIRIWHANIGGKSSSVIRPLIDIHGEGGVGHVSIETPNGGYLSLWPTKSATGEVTAISGSPAAFVPSAEMDEKFEQGKPADYIFDLYSLDPEQINIFIESLTLTDPYKDRVWLKGHLPKEPEEYSEPDAMESAPELHNIDEYDGAKNPSKTSRKAGPFKPWKVIAGAAMKLGSKVGQSFASSVYNALLAGGLTERFRLPKNFARDRIAKSPNNMIGLLLSLKAQELIKYPEILGFTAPQPLTAKERLKHQPSAEQIALRSQLQKSLAQLAKLKTKHTDTQAKIGTAPWVLGLEKILTSAIKAIAKQSKDTPLITQDLKFTEAFINELEKIDALLDQVEQASDPDPSKNSDILQQVSILHKQAIAYVINRGGYRQLNLLSNLKRLIIAALDYINKRIFDYTDSYEGPKLVTRTYVKATSSGFAKLAADIPVIGNPPTLALLRLT